MYKARKSLDIPCILETQTFLLGCLFSFSLFPRLVYLRKKDELAYTYECMLQG
jgi:hypothetical protein